MMAGSSKATNTLLAVIAVLLLLVVLYLAGIIGPRRDEAELRIETPGGDAEVDIDP